MANYITTDTEITSIANAIRSKAGITTQLQYPDDFVTAITTLCNDGYTWETLYSDTMTFTGNFNEENLVYNTISPWSTTIEPGSVWKITWNNETYLCVATEELDTGGKGYCIGNCVLDGGTSGHNEPFLMQIYDFSGDRLLIATEASSALVKIEKQVPVSNATLVYKTIAANGTYSATNDNADGYSTVVVSVSDEDYIWETVYEGTASIHDEGDTGYIDVVKPFPEPIVKDSIWRVTYNGTPYVLSALEEVHAGDGAENGYAIGNCIAFGGTTGNNEPFFAQQYWPGTDPTLIFGTLADSGTVTLKVERQVGKTLITKTVTANGVYNASTDNATGYSTVNVNVPFVTYHVGYSEPASSLGDNGDLYLQLE